MLSDYIKYYWIVKTDETDNISVQTIPSGCTHLVFHRGNNMYYECGNKQPACFLRGQFSLSGNILSTGNMNMIAVIFKPLGFRPFFSFHAKLLYNKYIDIEDIENKGFRELSSRIKNEENTKTCISYIEQFFISRLKEEDYNTKRIKDATQIITNNEPVNVEQLANSACLGYRQFKRVFEEYVGISPKEYYRVIRFQRALYFLQINPQIKLTQLAYECGYYDSSHFVKDFKSFSGYSPVEYLLTHSPHSTFFSEYCKLNLIKRR